MEVRSDFRELLESFNAHGVEYVVVGAFALAHFGSPRLTSDLDVLVKPTRENAERVMAALRDFGLGSLDLTIEDFSTADMVVQLGVAPGRIDIATSVSGVSWDEVWAERSAGKLGSVDVYFIGREQFVANKRATGRKKDLADLEAIGEK